MKKKTVVAILTCVKNFFMPMLRLLGIKEIIEIRGEKESLLKRYGKPPYVAIKEDWVSRGFWIRNLERSKTLISFSAVSNKKWEFQGISRGIIWACRLVKKTLTDSDLVFIWFSVGLVVSIVVSLAMLAFWLKLFESMGLPEKVGVVSFFIIFLSVTICLVRRLNKN